MELLGTSMIGFERGQKMGETLQGFDPILEKLLLPTYYSASENEVNKCVTLASQAFSSYSMLSGQVKAKFLNLIATKIESLGEILTNRVCAETALPLMRVQGEVVRTCSQIRMFASLLCEGSWLDARIDTPNAERKPKPKPDTRSILKPLGPVAVFCASNFPLAFSVAGGDTISALAAGCPVVVNAHFAHPGTAELIGTVIKEAVQESGLPEGVFSLLYGKGERVGSQLVEHPSIKAVGFTGSRKGGLALTRLAQNRPEPIPVYAEMSCINPIFILPGALAEQTEEIAANLYSSITLGAGQFCTKPGLIFCQKGRHFEKLEAFLKMSVNNSSPFTLLTPGIQLSYTSAIKTRRNEKNITHMAIKEHVSSHKVCEVVAEFHKTNVEGFLSHAGFQEEVFGPYALFVTYENSSQLSEIVNRLQGCLTVAVFGTDDDLFLQQNFVNQLAFKAGRVLFNDYPTGVEVNHSIVHGGPFPATSDGRSSSVGTRSIYRFVRPVCYQNAPQSFLPDELKNKNPLGIMRIVDGLITPA